MKIVDSVAQLKKELLDYSDRVVGFVPTMGALHEGHLTLVRRAREVSDVVVVSIFVNPTQFNDPKDLDSYPRTLGRDSELLERSGVDILFAPSIVEVYPEPDQRVFDLGGVDLGMEGSSRPGHFNGVAQVVSRLFDIVRPTKAIFGEKDFQQVAVIRAMVATLALDVEIDVVPTVREEDGLALSSRNQLLSDGARKAAPVIYAALRSAQQSAGEHTLQQIQAAVVRDVEAGGLLRVIYFETVDALTMKSVDRWEDSDAIQGCIAVQAGAVRLIDNIKLK